MALTLTPRRRFGVALGVVFATVSTGLIGFAGTASAHTNSSEASCDEKQGVTTLWVDLKAYNESGKNFVKITDGETVLHEDEFGKGYKDEFQVPGDVDHTFTIDVKAHDDPTGENKWTFAKVIEVEKCVQPTEPPVETTTPPVETTTEPAPPSSEAPPAPTTTSPEASPVAEEEPLAETGASIALPLGIGGVLVVGGVVALFVVRRRGKA